MKLQAAKKGSSIILLTFLVASIFLLPQSASAYPKPSTPEFTARYVDYSYYVAPVYDTDEFTGKTVIKQEGYQVNDQSVQLTMKNQPHITYNDSDGNVIGLYFNFRYKGHYGTEWRYYPFNEGGGGTHRYGGLNPVMASEVPQITQSPSMYTVKNFTLAYLFGVNAPSVGDQADFQVQALIGHIDYGGDGFYGFIGQAGDWSNTQTVTIGNSSPSITTTTAPTPTSENTFPQAKTPTSNSTNNPIQSSNQQNAATEFDWQAVVITVLGVCMVLLIVVIAVQQRRLSKISAQLQNHA
jgi:hypothetical protein